jgi:hypothetical protein
LRSALRELSADQNPVVRMQAAHGLLLITPDAGAPSTTPGRLRAHILAEQDENVLAVQLQILQRVMTSAPAAEVDQLVQELADRPQGAFLRQDDPDEGSANGNSWSRRSDLFELASAILARLAVVDSAPFSAHRLSYWLARPIRDAARTQVLIRHLQPYVNPPGGTGQEATFTLLAAAAHGIQTAWRTASTASAAGGDQATSTGARDAALIAHQVARQLDLASAAHDEKSSGSHRARGADTVFADYALPLLCDLSLVQHPQVTQPVVQALIRLGNTRPAEALQAIADAIPETGPYVADPLAASTICPYLTRLLAENRDLVLGTESGLTAFRHLLQAFAGAGHADALALAYTFSDSFR